MLLTGKTKQELVYLLSLTEAFGGCTENVIKLAKEYLGLEAKKAGVSDSRRYQCVCEACRLGARIGGRIYKYDCWLDALLQHDLQVALLRHRNIISSNSLAELDSGKFF